ncbi:MAG: outer membrane beta-barrel protein [Bacteroidales bacterium]|nr:outer membrane beta-barrel protein [Bacteroidales bacterium]
MKKYFLLLGLIFIFVSFINSQNNIGIFVGGGISDMRMITNDAVYNKEINKEITFLPEYYGGFNFENIIIEKKLYFQFGIQAISRGYSSDNDSVSYFIHNAYIPLELKYKYFFSKRGEAYIFASAGSYVAASYKGTKKDIVVEEAAAADTTGTITFSPEIKFGKLSSDDFEPIDFGLNASLGFGYSHIQIAYNLSLGLRNMVPSELVSDIESAGETAPKLKHMNHSITIGFYFTNK